MFYYGTTLLFLGLTGFCGFGLAALTLPRNLRRHALLFAPWFGIAYLGAAVYLCYRCDAPGTDHYALWLLLPPLALGVLAVLRRRRSEHIVPWLNADVLPAFLPLAAAILLLGAYTHRAADFPTSISIGNNDISYYSFTAAFVKEHARSAAATLWGPYGGPPLILADVNWSTPAFLIAVASSLFHRQPFELATLVVNALFALTVALFHPFCRRLGFGRSDAVWLGLIYALSPLLGNVALNGLAGEVVGIGFLLMALTLVRSAGALRWRGTVALAAAFVGLLFGYAIAIPMVVLAALIVGPADFTGRGEGGFTAVRRVAWRVGAALAAALVLCEPRATVEARSLANLAGASTGWFVPWLSPAVLLGYFAPPALRTYGIPIAVALTGVLLGAALLASSRRRPAASLLVFGYLALYLFFCWNGRAEGHGPWGGYKSFKFATFLLPVFLAASAILLRRVARERPDFGAVIPLFCCFALFGSVISDFCTWKAMPGKLVLTPDLLALRAINARADVFSVTIPQLSPWETYWLDEMLSSKRLYIPPEPVPDAAVAGNWDLLRLADGALIPERQLFMVWTGVPRPGDLIRVTPEFGLRRHLSGPILAVVPDRGWWADEKDHRWTGSAGTDAAVEVFAARDGVKAGIDFAVELSAGEQMAVSLEGKEIARIAASGPQHLHITLHQGMNEVLVRSSLPPVHRLHKDSRLLGMRFTQWTVEAE